jgi:hypothetical protein
MKSVMQTTFFKIEVFGNDMNKMKIKFMKKLRGDNICQMVTMIQLPSCLLSRNVKITNRRTQIRGNKVFLGSQPNEFGFHVFFFQRAHLQKL